MGPRPSRKNKKDAAVARVNEPHDHVKYGSRLFVPFYQKINWSWRHKRNILFIVLDNSTFVQERVGKSWEKCKPILINRSTHDFVTDAGRSCFGGPVAERRTARASVAPAPVPGPQLRPRTAIRMGWPFLDRGRCTTIFRSWILCCSLLVSALQSNQCQWIKHYHFLKFLSRFCFTLLSFPRRHRIAVKSKKYRWFKSQRGSWARIFPSSTQKVFS